MTKPIFHIRGSGPESPQTAQQSVSPKHVPEDKISSIDPNEKSNLWDSELERYVLHPVILKSSGTLLAPRVYMEELVGSARMRGSALFLEAGGKVGFNNYANSFFASYWEKFTDIRSLSLCGKIEGEGLIYLFRSTGGDNTTKIGEYPVSGTFHVNFDMFCYRPHDEGAGRFFFDLEAVTDITVTKMAFGGFTPPQKTATFSLGVCTYRKESYVTNLALSLEAYVKRGGKAIAQVTIVNNQGTDEALPVLRKVAGRTCAFRLISQNNAGGAGGFARGLHESQKSEIASHHIFMDDDVYLDPQMLDRLQAFVSYCREPCVVGGQMMNMADPKMLYEGGGKLDYWGFLYRVGEDIDGSLGAEVSFFDRVREVDYNAWWFACVPKHKAHALGLPLNIFMRGDDFEYGLRMAQAGVPTVSLPGVFLWHEPFEAKAAAWLEYYNSRNRLIVTAIYADSKNFGIQPVNMLRDTLAGFLQAKQYDAAFAMGLGVLDFLRGPEATLKRDAEDLHIELRKSLAEMSEDSTAIVACLEAKMADMGKQPETHPSLYPMLHMINAAQLGRYKRDAETFPWINDPIVGVLEAILARYAAEAEVVAPQWQAKAHSLSSDVAWSALYGWA